MTLSAGQVPLSRLRSYASRAAAIQWRLKNLLADLSIQNLGDDTVGMAAAATIATDRLIRALDDEIDRAKAGGTGR